MAGCICLPRVLVGGVAVEFDDHHVVVEAYVVSRDNDHVVPLAGVGYHSGDSVRWWRP